jgi:hypothetical protein
MLHTTASRTENDATVLGVNSPVASASSVTTDILLPHPLSSTFRTCRDDPGERKCEKDLDATTTITHLQLRSFLSFTHSLTSDLLVIIRCIYGDKHGYHLACSLYKVLDQVLESIYGLRTYIWYGGAVTLSLNLFVV